MAWVNLNELYVPREQYESDMSELRDLTSGIKLLWQNIAGIYLQDDQTIDLEEPVQDQLNGIVLHWQAYVPGDGVKNYQHNYVFVPKTHTYNEYGEGVSMLLSSDSYLVNKYVYVMNTQITGRAQNASSNFSCQGMTLDNRRQVLTEVFGV